MCIKGNSGTPFVTSAAMPVRFIACQPNNAFPYLRARAALTVTVNYFHILNDLINNISTLDVTM